MHTPSTNRFRISVIAAVFGVVIGGIVVATAAWRNKANVRKCISNLKILDAVKWQWALETHKQTNLGATATLEDLRPWLANVCQDHDGAWTPLRCPDGGKYALGRLADVTTCSHPGHVLPSDHDWIPGWIESRLISAWEKGATELVLRVGAQDTENTSIDCKINGSWHHWDMIPKDVRPRIVTELRREANLLESAYPNDGDIVVPCSRVQFRWHLRIDGPVAECRMTAPAHLEPNEKRTNELSDDWWWKGFTNAVSSQVASEARGLPPPFSFQGSWQQFWERRIETLKRGELDPEKHIAYIKSQRQNAGLRDYDWSH